MNPVYAPLGVAGIMSRMNQRTVSVERWRGIVEEQQASGLSVAAFCRRSRVPQSSFFAWRRKLSKAVTFAEVPVAAPPCRFVAVPIGTYRFGMVTTYSVGTMGGITKVP